MRLLLRFIFLSTKFLWDSAFSIVLCATAIHNLAAVSAFLETHMPLSFELQKSLCREQSRAGAVSRRQWLACNSQAGAVGGAALCLLPLLTDLTAPAYFKYCTRTELHIVFRIKIGCLELLISLSLL